jgi:hypothetical protein
VSWSDEEGLEHRVRLRVQKYAGYVQLHPLDVRKKNLVLGACGGAVVGWPLVATGLWLSISSTECCLMVRFLLHRCSGHLQTLITPCWVSLRRHTFRAISSRKLLLGWLPLPPFPSCFTRPARSTHFNPRRYRRLQFYNADAVSLVPAERPPAARDRVSSLQLVSPPSHDVKQLAPRRNRFSRLPRSSTHRRIFWSATGNAHVEHKVSSHVGREGVCERERH